MQVQKNVAKALLKILRGKGVKAELMEKSKPSCFFLCLLSLIVDYIQEQVQSGTCTGP